MEIWKSIIGYEGFYEVSNYGNVRSVDRVISTTVGERKYKGRQLSPSKNKSGYYYVILNRSNTKKTFRVHKLVLETFNPINDESFQINHKDRDKANNRLDNLEWCSASENIKHSYETGHSKIKGILQIDKETLKVINKFNSALEAQRITGCDNSHILKVCRGERKTTGGFIWQFAD